MWNQGFWLQERRPQSWFILNKFRTSKKIFLISLFHHFSRTEIHFVVVVVFYLFGFGCHKLKEDSWLCIQGNTPIVEGIKGTETVLRNRPDARKAPYSSIISLAPFIYLITNKLLN